MRTVPIHNLRPNHAVWTPPAVAYFDTETHWTGDEQAESHTLRCWNAQLHVRRHRRLALLGSETESGETGDTLADVIADWAHRHPTLWVYAHNLAFDLTTSGLTGRLAEYGYTVTEFAVDSSSPFIRMTNGRSRITFADSFSWLPVKLDEVAAQIGGHKVPLPANDAGLSDWLARCAADTDLLARAMAAVMDWWDAAGLGKWSVTGSASGWNAMRHKIDARRFTINPDTAGIAADRQAVYGGRRGLWRHGPQPAGRYAELDFSAAYPTIASSLPLPLERMARFDSLPLDHAWLTSQRHGVIARVRLDTGRALWPARIAGRVWYPVGELWTTLAGPDIQEAMRHGVLCEIGAGYVHRLGYALKPWADWCLALSRGDDDSAPPVVALWSKHCGRAVIGKWAQRGYQTIPLGPAPVRGWHASEGWNHTAGVKATIIDFDGRRWQASASGDGDNCYPAVLAYVESYTRVRLGRLIESVPSAAMVACDTDGTIIDLRQLGNWRADDSALWPLTPRIKNRYMTAVILGPQHMTLDGANRMAGIPAGATRLPDGRLTAMTWPKLTWQMANSEQGTYVRPNQSYRTAATYAPGWITDFDRVKPVQTEIDGDGNTVIVPWPRTWYARQGIRLGDTQNAALERYRHDTETEQARPDNSRSAARQGI
jgi:hypothetical protein